MADKEKSFVFLHDNVPQWFTHLDEIQEKITHMQDEIAKAPASRRPTMRRKTGSVESIRDMDGIMEGPSTPTAAQQTRKPASVLSAAASGPSRYRSRAMIVVYYDGKIQKQFETLVRSIGSGRNLLRKGKMAAMARRMAEMASSDDDSEDGDEDDVVSKIEYRRRTGLSAKPSRGPMRGGRQRSISDPTTDELVFDSVDKALEQAQSLCERAAHQSLRDGQCGKELEGMRRYFQEVLASATTEVAKYKMRAERQTDAEQPTAEGAGRRTSQLPRMPTESKPTLPAIRSVPTLPATTKEMDIEIDDDEDDDGDFVMPPVRMTSRV